MNYRRAFVQNSFVFITIVTNNRTPILIDNMNLLLQVVNNVKQIYEFEIFSYCVLKDHIHCILSPQNINDYPKIIKSFKYAFTKNFYKTKDTTNKVKLWQNRYWEHTILSEEDLWKHADYIHYNSLKHYNIAPKDWEYSSFNKFVKNDYYELNWCNVDDKYNIKELTME